MPTLEFGFNASSPSSAFGPQVDFCFVFFLDKNLKLYSERCSWLLSSRNIIDVCERLVYKYLQYLIIVIKPENKNISLCGVITTCS